MIQKHAKTHSSGSRMRLTVGLTLVLSLLVIASARGQNLAAPIASNDRESDPPRYAGPLFQPTWQSSASDAPVIERLPSVTTLDSIAQRPQQGLSADFAPIFAATPATDSQRLADLEKRYDELQKQVKASAAKPAEKKSEFPTFRATGFLQLDTAFYGQNSLNIATVGNAQDGTEFRRARLAIQGKVTEFTSYQLEMEFAAAGRPSFFDNYVEQSNLPILGALRVGQYLQPFSVDAMSGFRHLPFLERSLPFLTFVPFRRIGIMSSNSSANQYTNWAYSFYRIGGFNNAPLGDDRAAADFGDKGDYSFSGRVTQLLMFDEPAQDRYLWHVGGGYNYSRLGANTAPGSGTPGNAGGGSSPFYQAKTLPEFGILGLPELSQSFGSSVNGTPTFVDSGRYQARDFHLVGVETVYQAGAFSFQSEWMATIVNSNYAGPIFYNGAYAEVMYRLTGEHREYDKKLAALRNVVPFTNFFSLRGAQRGIYGWGAWEVAARLSFVELRNPAALNGHYYVSSTGLYNGASTPGNGTLTDTTLGFTWFLNAHTKIQGNWIHCMLDNVPKGSSTADLFVSRVQVDF